MKIHTHSAFSFYPKQRHFWEISLRESGTFTKHGVTKGNVKAKVPEMHLCSRIRTNRPTSTVFHDAQPEGRGGRTKINTSSNWQQCAAHAGRADTARSLF